MGVLSLPYVCKMVGLGVALPLLTLGFGASFWSLGLLVDVADRLQCRRFVLLCLKTGGGFLGGLYQACVFAQHLGALISYQIISSQFTIG